jgi:monovalent cation/proton antiporter MnhG/PhaG subunit
VSVRIAAADVLLVLGVLTELICVIGVVWLRDVFDRLHFVGAGSTVGPVLVGIAVCVNGMSTASALAQSLAALAALVVLNPVLTHATGRAAHGLRGTRSGAARER